MKSRILITVQTVTFLLCILGIFSGSAMAQSYTFNASSLPTGHNPQAVANGDLNGDTRPDLVIANFNDNTVSVLIGNPDGSYKPRVDYATGNNPTAVLLADFNNDTKLDIAVVNNNCPALPCTAVGSISTLLGNGDGTFQAHVDINVGNSPNALGVADFNVDGKLDLVVTNGQDNTMTSLLGTGTGGFSSKRTFPTGLNPHGVAVGDFTNEGKLDAVVANSGESDITLFRGKGDGTFSQPLLFETGPNPVSVVGVDFNGDTRLDVATANSGSLTVSVLMSKDPTGFIAHFELPVAGIPNAIVTADFNGDGKPDLAATSAGPDAVSVMLGNGNATFQSHVDFPTGFDAVALATGDFTGDGKIDLAVVNDLDETVLLLAGAGNGSFQSRTQFSTGNMPGGVATGDFNGDLKEDIAVANRTDNTITILLGNDDGTFTPAGGALPHTGIKPVGIISVDVDGDGKLDLIVANSGDNTVSVLLGRGDGTFQNPISVGVGKKPVALAAGDFNSDGKLDVAVCNQNDPSVGILIGNGIGGFVLVHSYFTGTGSNPTGIAVGDFLGNGKLDIAVANSGVGTVGVLIGAGNGTFAVMISYAAAAGTNDVAVGDFNGDGMKDLAASNGVSNSVSILLGNNSGSFPTHVEYPTANNPLSIKVGDFNNDNHQDVVVGTTNSSSNRASILIGKGDGTFQPRIDRASRFSLAGNGEPLAVNDFNSDGSSDIALVDQLANSVFVFLSRPQPVAFPQLLNFGTGNIGVHSAPKSVTLWNAGGAILQDLAVTISGDYDETTSCPASLGVGDNCPTSVTFTPTDGGTRAGNLTFTDNADGPPQNVALTGIGNAPTADLSVTSLTFAVTQVKVTSAKQNITLTNNGNQTLLISSIATTNEFKYTTTCPFPPPAGLAAGNSCVISVAFRPVDSGTRTGTLTITDNAVHSPQVVSLTGIGTIVQLVPNSLSFGEQQVGTPSAAKDVTMTNVGTRALNITDISVTGTNSLDFTRTHTCGTGLARGASCTISVIFTPTQVGTRKAFISIEDDGGGSPQTVPLSGVGVN